MAFRSYILQNDVPGLSLSAMVRSKKGGRGVTRSRPLRACWNRQALWRLWLTRRRPSLAAAAAPRQVVRLGRSESDQARLRSQLGSGRSSAVDVLDLVPCPLALRSPLSVIDRDSPSRHTVAAIRSSLILLPSRPGTDSPIAACRLPGCGGASGWIYRGIPDSGSRRLWPRTVRSGSGVEISSAGWAKVRVVRRREKRSRDMQR